jgi:hypothetical protein
MTTTTKPMTNTDPTPTAPSVAALTTQRDAARHEVAELRALDAGHTLRVWRTRTAIHAGADATGLRRVEHEVTEHVLVSDPVDVVAQLRARQLLPAAESRLLELEADLAQAERAAAIAARVAHQRRVQDGEQLLRRELPALLRDLRASQAKWTALQAQCEALDAALGRPIFAEWALASLMAPTGVVDTFIANACTRFDLPTV